MITMLNVRDYFRWQDAGDGAMMRNDKGFSLIEVLLGVSIFMIGFLGITALQIASLKANTYSGNLSEATGLAASKIEALMALDYEDADLDDNQVSPAAGFGVDGLDDIGATADHVDANLGKNGIFSVIWNVAEDEPLPNCKRINVIVRWMIKDVPRQINITSTRVKQLGS